MCPWPGEEKTYIKCKATYLNTTDFGWDDGRKFIMKPVKKTDG